MLSSDTRVVTEAESLGVGRSERELALFAFNHNRKMDILCGICKPDFFEGQYWQRERLKKLWTNINSPCPGGNLPVPWEVTSYL